jgi:hypothetical protein
MKRFLALAVATMALSLSASELPVRQVVVFKNGIGLLGRAGDVEFRDGKASIGRLPAATYGGLWVASGGNGMVIEQVIARTSSTPHKGRAASIPELLDANDGRMVTLRLTDRELSGTIRSSANASYALVETGGRVTAVTKSEVRSLTADGTLATNTESTEPESVLELRSGRVNGTHAVSIASLERGIGWTPEYEVQLGDDGRAVISLRATLVNDAADLDDAAVSFAVGVPSFAFAEIRTPLDPEQKLSRFLESLSTAGWRRTAGPMANVMTQSVMVSDSATSDMVDLPDSLTEGERRQDLYLYRMDRVSLASGERGSYPLMTATVPFSHTWDWTIEDHRAISPYGYQENRPSEKIRDQVWHSVRLENRASVPWTTGPALTIAGGTPIAQSTLHYTPSGASTRLRLTVATDVAADHHEVEKARVAEPLRKFGTTYEGIDYEGTLSITNHRSERVTIDVTRTLTGAVTTSGGGKAVRLAEEPSAVNPRSKLDWSVPVGPGETRSLTYQYRVWVRR